MQRMLALADGGREAVLAPPSRPMPKSSWDCDGAASTTSSPRLTGAAEPGSTNASGHVRARAARPGLYAARGWRLPASIGRVYDSGRAERVLGFRFGTDFAAVPGALRSGGALPFIHDPGYVSPQAKLS